MDDLALPLYVDLAAVAAARTDDATDALRTLERLEVRLAHVGPGRMPGDGWAVASRRWEGRLLLHHACLAEPDAPRWNLAAGDDEVRRQAVAEAAETMRVAAGLGAPCYSVHAGWALKLTRDGSDRPTGDTITSARAADQLCRSLDQLALLADGLGIALLVEPAPFVPAERPAFADPERMRAVLERLAAPPLGLLVDLPALVVTARRVGEEPETVLDYLGPWVRGVELHRGDGAGKRHLPVREADVELALAKLAGGLAWPVVIAAHGLGPAVLRDQLAMARELLAPPAPPAPPEPVADPTHLG